MTSFFFIVSLHYDVYSLFLSHDLLGSSKWNKQVALFNHESVPMKLLFHNYEPHLIVANDKDSIRYLPI